MKGLKIQLYDSLTRRVEPFTPMEEGRVGMYHCGPTVYGRPHIGNLSAFMLADLLRRVMEYAGYDVTQVMNITDVGHLTVDDVADAEGEDKLERAARRLQKTPWDLARLYTRQFFEDLDHLKIKAAHYYPRATEFIPEMIALIERLEAKGLAYRAGGNVYFDVGAFEGYGKLSGNTLEALEAGARVEVRGEKKSPYDFALWKRDPKHVMQWESPFGRGFPGWHIECSAMSMRFLGETFDIHTGGEDNVFPHHECEIAQSEGATGKPFARRWLHTRHMMWAGQKMSKSLGNVYELPDLLKRGYRGREVRYALISTHYRAQASFSFEVLDAARQALRRIDAFVYKLERESAGAKAAADEPPAPVVWLEQGRAAFDTAVAHDLNISGALAALFDLVKAGNKEKLAPEVARDALATLKRWDTVLGVMFGWEASEPTEEGSFDPSGCATRALSDEAIDAKLADRAAARKRKDFAEADRIRDELKAAGIEVEDRPEGARWVRL